jgi:hypothetical protein
MREQKRIDTHGLNHPAERFRQMPIDKNGTTIAAIPGNVGHIVLAADDLHAPSNRLHYIEQNRRRQCLPICAGLLVAISWRP